jgi:predicted branched-subunit amino acid permease
VSAPRWRTDEAFALGAAHFARVGRTDRAGYWIAALVSVYVPWNIGTAIGAIAGGVVPDLSAIGIDAVFPATMAALAVAAWRATRTPATDASPAHDAAALVPA